MAKHQSSVVLHSNTVLLVMLRTCFLTDRRTLDRRVRSAFLGYRQEMHACASLGSFPVQRLAKYVPSRMTTCPSGPLRKIGSWHVARRQSISAGTEPTSRRSSSASSQLTQYTNPPRFRTRRQLQHSEGTHSVEYSGGRSASSSAPVSGASVDNAVSAAAGMVLLQAVAETVLGIFLASAFFRLPGGLGCDAFFDRWLGTFGSSVGTAPGKSSALLRGMRTSSPFIM